MTKCRKKGVFFLWLICQQHVVSGGILVGDAKSEVFLQKSASTQFPSGASTYTVEDDGLALMTRPERARDFGEPPPPNVREQHNIDGARSEGGDFSPDQESDGDHYQMAFIFQLGFPPVSKRLFWDDYWPMHRQIANACGVSIGELVGVHHVRHQPADLEELELQSVIAQKI